MDMREYNEYAMTFGPVENDHLLFFRDEPGDLQDEWLFLLTRCYDMFFGDDKRRLQIIRLIRKIGGLEPLFEQEYAELKKMTDIAGEYLA